MSGQFRVFTGISNDELADLIARGLGVRLGASGVLRFPDGEVSVEILEPVRNRDVLIVQPTSPPVNDHLVELLAFVDACRRAGARRITASCSPARAKSSGTRASAQCSSPTRCGSMARDGRSCGWCRWRR